MDENPLTIETVDVTTDSGEVFKFRIPSPRAYARVGARAHELRRQDSPSTGGSEYGLDIGTQDLYRGIAILELLLVKADAKDNWPYSENDNGQASVNSDKFPPSATPTIMEVARKFENTFFEFIKGGPGQQVPTSP